MQEGFGIRPGRTLTPREARLWQFFSGTGKNGQDLFFSAREWPDYLVSMALLEHKNHRERYRLFLFLTANGLHPDLAEDWVRMTDIRPDGTPLFRVYDVAANRDFRDLHNRATSGVLYDQCSLFDMILGRVRDNRFHQ